MQLSLVSVSKLKPYILVVSDDQQALARQRRARFEVSVRKLKPARFGLAKLVELVFPS